MSAAYDWVKNCACIADFYQSMDKQQIAALALSSAQKVLEEKVIQKSGVAGGGGGGGGGAGVTAQDCIELNAEIKKKWIKLDMKMMKIAFEVETERVLASDRGEPFSPPTYENDLDDLHMYQEHGSEIPDKQQCELLNSSDVILEGAVVDQSTSSVTTMKEVSNIVLTFSYFLYAFPYIPIRLLTSSCPSPSSLLPAPSPSLSISLSLFLPAPSLPLPLPPCFLHFLRANTTLNPNTSTP